MKLSDRQLPLSEGCWYLKLWSYTIHFSLFCLSIRSSVRWFVKVKPFVQYRNMKNKFQKSALWSSCWRVGIGSERKRKVPGSNLDRTWCNVLGKDIYHIFPTVNVTSIQCRGYIGFINTLNNYYSAIMAILSKKVTSIVEFVPLFLNTWRTRT